MIAYARLLLFVIAVGLAGPAHATTVLLLTTESSEGSALVEAELVAEGTFTDADITQLASPATPLLADLTPHDVILMWSDVGLEWDDSAALGDVLADYVDAGGAVVLAAHVLGDEGAPLGRFAAESFSPVGTPAFVPVAGDIDFASPDTDPAHPVLAGLSAVTFSDFDQGDPPLAAAGQLVAVDTGGALVVASTCDRSVIAVNLYPPAMIVGEPVASAEVATLLAQALEATQLDAPPIAAAGGPYDVDEGGTVGLDASGSTVGDLGPLSFDWDLDGDAVFGDASVSTPTFDAAALDGPSSVSPVVRVTDSCGRTSEATGAVSVLNVAPSIDSSGDDGPVDEGQAITFSASASDVSGDPLSYSWDPGDSSPALAGAGVSHTYADSGSYPVTLTVTDGDGGEATVELTAAVTNLAPVLESLVGDGGGPVGTPLAFSGVASDAGGAADPLTWTWSWGDGSPDDVGVDLTDASHSWSSPGTYDVDVEVADDDGKEVQASLSVVVSNPGPEIEFVTAPPALDEAASGSWTVAAADVVGGSVHLAWSWGDGTPGSAGDDLVTVSHAYADDGSYSVTVVATDDFGAVASVEAAVQVDNLDPSFLSSPSGLATEGVLYTAALSATDVPADQPDLLISSVQSPAGAVFVPATATFEWSPTLPEALGGAATFTAMVSDGDGGTDALTWQVVASFADGDDDGMADSWEEGHGLDPGLDDSGLDPDGDGLSNLEEWLGGTDPETFDGPSAPVPVDPVAGASVDSASPALQVANATDPSGDVLVYDFEVYADLALISLLASADDLPEGAGTTSWTVDVALAENTTAHWRARAADPLAPGPWSATEPFFVDVANDPPTVPTPLSPIDQTVDSGVAPMFASAVTDPEGDALSVEIEILDDGGSLVALLDAALEPDGTWRAVPDPPLPEDATYTWSARALDDRGGDSGPSASVTFHVDVTNSSPPMPVLVAPADGAEIATAAPQLEVTVGPDPDGDPITVVFTVDVGPAFASDERQDHGPVEPSGGDAAVVVDPLPENGVAWARARTEDDRGGASQWLVWSFLVDAVDEAPGAVRVVAPGEDEVVAGAAVTVRWAPALDPEGDALTYALDVRALADDEVVWSAQGLVIEPDASEGVVELDVELGPGAWLVRAKATDATDRTGPWGPDNRFAVLPAAGESADLTAGEGPYGCDCASAFGGRSAAAPGLLLALLGLSSLRTSRRRRRRCAR